MTSSTQLDIIQNRERERERRPQQLASKWFFCPRFSKVFYYSTNVKCSSGDEQKSTNNENGIQASAAFESSLVFNGKADIYL